MRKDLEVWLRGGTAQAFEAVTDAPDLQLPPEPEEPRQAPGIAPADAADDVLHKASAEETIEELIEEPMEEIEETEAAVEKFPVKDLSEAEDDAETPNGAETPPPALDENETYDENENGCGYGEKRAAAGELLGEAGLRLAAMRMTRMNDSQRVGRVYERSGFRRNRRRFVSICAIAVIIACIAIALFRSTQRNSYDAMMERAAGLYEQQQYAAAFETYSDASQRYPDRAEPFLGTAHAAERIGRVEESIAAYHASLERFPSDDTHSRAGVFYEIGRLHSILKAWEKAQESFEEVIAADAANYGAYFSLGNVFEEQGQPDMALEAYSQALELSPASDAAREAVRRVSLVLAAKDEEEDESTLVERRFVQAFNSGNASLEEKQYREASQYFAEALAIRSADADAWVGFAEARDKLGDVGGARKSLERALERNPEHETAKLRLAEMTAGPSQPAQNTAPRRETSSAQQSSVPSASAQNSAAEIQKAPDGGETMFKAGVEQYLKGEYDASFNSFIACLRSSEPGSVSFASLAGLAGDPGPVWKTPQVALNAPSEAGLLAEIVRVNPKDRNLYVNLLMAGAKMGIDRETLRSTLNEARSHALERTNTI